MFPSTQGSTMNDALASSGGSNASPSATGSNADMTFLRQTQTQTAEIVSCSGWALNKLPELKSFLKDGEAESYVGVTVKYVHGRTAVMTIYDDQKNVVEKVDLHVIKSKKRLHEIMKEKGFVRKGDDSASNKSVDVTESLRYSGNIPMGTILLLRIAIIGVCLFIMIRFYKFCKIRQSKSRRK